MKDGEKHIITTQSWFYAPDGQSYRAAWGTVKIVEAKDVFNFTPNRHHDNWYVQIGNDENMVQVAGCEALYSVRCEQRPSVQAGEYKDKDTGREEHYNNIYFTE